MANTKYVSIIINIYVNDDADILGTLGKPCGPLRNIIRKGPHPLYRTQAVLKGSQMSNDIWLYGDFVYFH